MTQWFDGYVLANGVNLHYYRTGGKKPPVVLLHGFTDNGLCWTRLASDLEQDYDMIMVDARGHGHSSLPETQCDPANQAADVVGLIQELKLEHPRLIGHSMGAVTAAFVATTYPEQVRSIILEDPPWIEYTSVPTTEEKGTEDVSGRSWEEWLTKVRSQTREERIAQVHAENPQWAEVELGPWADSKVQFNFDIFQRNLSFARYSWKEVARSISCPILLIIGDPERGAIVTPGVAQEAAQGWREGQVAHIANASHNIRRDQYEQYKAVVTAFLREK